jgi:drug/metabolite transporter (DMT)-like permease
VQAPAQRVFVTGMALALAGAVLFSAKAVVVKLAYRHGVDPTTLIALRMLVALPFFIGTFLWVARGAPALAPSDHARLVVIGLLGYYAASNLDFVGLQYVSAGLERLILYLSPTLVLLLSVALLGKPLARTDWLALALSYAGIALAVWHDARLEGERTAFGATLIVGSAVCYALYLVMAGEGVGRIGALRLTSYAMGVSTLAVLVHFALVHPLHVLAQPAPVLWLSLLNGVLCTVAPVSATMLAIERIGWAAPRSHRWWVRWRRSRWHPFCSARPCPAGSWPAPLWCWPAYTCCLRTGGRVRLQ